MPEIRLLTLDPGHFHAALVQKEMTPGIDPRVHVYAPLGPDLLGHLARIHGFNTRPEAPTSWRLEVHTGPDWLERALAEKPGTVAILSGRNRGKIERIQAALAAGLHVLADKPWIIDAADLPRLQAALDDADARGLVALDIMTERQEITSLLQRELVNDAGVFGNVLPGSIDEPGVFMESVHYLLKMVAGAPNRRPAWFFDIHQQGEALTDVGTHLVDLAAWILFPDQAISSQTDLEFHLGRRWPTFLTRADFHKVTGEADFPAFLGDALRGDRLAYYCNNLVFYSLRGVHVRLNVLWDYESAAGGDTHHAVIRGSRSRVEVRQGVEQHYRPELYVVANTPALAPAVLAALQDKLRRLQTTYPGLALEAHGNEAQVVIPNLFRVGHEAHFGQVVRQFLYYLHHAGSLPAWEKPGMLAKYHATTQGVRLARMV